MAEKPINEFVDQSVESLRDFKDEWKDAAAKFTHRLQQNALFFNISTTPNCNDSTCELARQPSSVGV